MIDTDRPNYKWLILVLVTATFFFQMGMARAAIPVLFPEISAELGLSILQMGTVWGTEPFAGMFMALLGGLIVDHFGIKLTLPVTCLALGFFASLRGLANGFPSLAAAMFGFGLFAAMMPTMGSKAIAMWFDRRHLGLANSISIMGVTVGLMAGSAVSATVLSPLLGGWRNVLFLMGAPAAVFAVLWYIAARGPAQPAAVPTVTPPRVPLRQSLVRVLKIRQLWLASLFMLGAQGAYASFTGYLPTYLRKIGWEPVLADTALTVFLGSVAFFSPLMAMVSDRIGSRKKVMVPALVTASLALGVLPWVSGAAVWPLIVIQGMMRSGIIALFVSLVMETKGVGTAYAGTAIGVANTIFMLGAAVLPPMGNALADIDLGLPLVFWAAISLLLLTPMIFVKETKQSATIG